MPWFKVDDGFHAHPKAQRVSNASLGLWVRLGSYCASYLLDGHVEGALVEKHGKPKEAEGLVAAGLWVPEGDGYRFHDWAEYQPTAEQVRAERARARDRQAKLRARRLANYDAAIRANNGLDDH